MNGVILVVARRVRPAEVAAESGWKGVAITGAAAILTGGAAGVTGVLLILLLHAVQYIAFGYSHESFLLGVQQANDERRVLALTLGGGLVGIGWWIHRHLVRVTVSVTGALRSSSLSMKMGPVLSDGVLQMIAVGAGASLGREGAPREIGAALGARIGEWLGVLREDRRLLLAAGAGAGLAAVYNVPFSGAVFSLEALLVTLKPRAVLVAGVSSLVATVTARAFFGDHPTYRLSSLTLSPGLLLASLVIGPASALGAMLFRAAMTRARTKAPHGWRSAIAVTVVFAGIGVASIAYPQILGNGKSLAQAVFSSPTSLTTLAALALAKPLATWLCLRSGAVGGLLTPAFATGATLGALLAHIWGRTGAGSEPAAFALMGATAFLAIAQRIPITAGVLALELTHLGINALLPLALTLTMAWLTARVLSLAPWAPWLRRRTERKDPR